MDSYERSIKLLFPIIRRIIPCIGIILMTIGLAVAVKVFYEQGMLIVVEGRVTEIDSCPVVEFTADGRVFRDTAYSAKGMSNEEFETLQTGDNAVFYAYRHHGEHFHLTDPMSYFSSYLISLIFILPAALLMLIYKALGRGNERKAKV